MLKVIGGVPDGEYKAIASGSLPNGKPVVVNADGTVSVAASSEVSETVGTAATFETATVNYTSPVFDSSNNKIVIAYRDTGNSNYGTAIVGTVSGNSISFGTAVVFESAAVEYVAATFDSNSNKVVIGYRDSPATDGVAIVGTVSGTSISFGSPVIFDTNNVSDMGAAFDSDTNQVIFAYQQGGTNSGVAIVGSVSGTSISFGSVITVDSQRSAYNSVAYDTNAQKVVIAFQDDSNLYGAVRVGTVSGTSISFGSKTYFASANTRYSSITYDSSAQKVVIAYSDFGNSNKGTAIVGEVSGTSISFGSEVVFEDAVITNVTSVYDPTSNKTIVSYSDDGNGQYGTFSAGTVSGTSISFTTPVVYQTSLSTHLGLAADTNAGKVVTSYNDGSANYGKAVVYNPDYTSTTLTAENYIGISKGVVSETSSVVGSETIFENAAARYTATAYDTTNNKIVIAYEDDANFDYGTAIVGTVSGNTISFGTPVVFRSANTDQQAIVFDENAGKVLITYRDNSDAKGYGIVGTVSGTSISFGSATQFESTNNPVSMDMSYDPDQQKCLLVWRANGAFDVGRAKVATISGTSVSFGSLTTFFNGPIFSPKVAYDTNQNKHVVCFVDDNNTDRGLAIIGTVSGTSVTFGSTVIFDSTITSNNVITYDSSVQKVVIAYTDESNSNEGTAVVGTVSGNSISFGSPIVFTNPGNFQDSSITYDSGAEKIVISFRNADNSSRGTVISGKVEGNTITFDTEEIFNSGGVTDYVSSAYDPDQGKVVIAYQDSPNADRGTCVVYQTGYTNRNPVADGANARLNIVGSVSENQSSLTAGEKYYVQTDGTLSTTAGSPSVLAGTAISATKLVVKT